MGGSEIDRALYVTRRNLLHAAGVVGAGFTMGATAGVGSASSASPAVAMHPTPFSDFVTQLTANPAGWSGVRNRIDGFGMHGHSVLLAAGANRFDVERQGRIVGPFLVPKSRLIARGSDIEGMPTVDWHSFSKLLALLEDDEVPLSVRIEGPGSYNRPFDATIADRAANATVQTYARPVENAGYHVDAFHVDGPIRGLKDGIGLTTAETQTGFDSWERAIEAYVEWAEAVRRRRPNIGFWSVVNLAGWNWKGSSAIMDFEWGDYHRVARRLLPAMADSAAGFEGVSVDFPYDMYQDYPRRVIELARMIREYDLQFDLTLVSAGAKDSDEEFADGAIRYARAMHEETAIPVDRYTVESWFDYPETVVPESDRNTLTGVTKAVIETVSDRSWGTTQQPGSGGDDRDDSLAYVRIPADTYVLINENSRQGLTATQGGDGNVTQQSFTDYDPATVWNARQVTGVRYRLSSLATDSVLDVEDPAAVQGGSATQNGWDGVQSQQWLFHTDRSLGRGVFAVVNARSRMALSVAGGKTTDGADVVQRPWTGDPSQQWIVYPV